MEMYCLQKMAHVADCIITSHYGTDIKTKLTFVKNQVLRGFYASALRYFSRLGKEKKFLFLFLSLFFDKTFTQRLDILDVKMKCDDKQPLIPIVKCMRQEYKKNKKEITKADAFSLSCKIHSS